MNSSDAQTELPQKALKKIRALCRGNGVEPDSVQIKSARGNIIKCQALTHIELHTEVKEQRKKGRLEVGKLVESAEHLQHAISQLTSNALKNIDTRKYVSKMLTDRPDKGFSVHAEYFEIEPLTQDYCFHEACGACQGQGISSCKNCGGKRREVCNKCRGRAMVPCNYCDGRGFIQGPDGQQKQCNRCFGKRQTACTICRKTGSISCRQCKGSGNNKCGGCGGQAFFTHIAHVIVKLKTLFEIDRAALPHPVIKIIEDNGGKMVENGHIKLHIEPVKREDGGLAIQYDLEFPYGDLELSINGKPLKMNLFGYKGKILKLPNFLDRLVGTNLQFLKEAADNQGPIPTKIKKSSQSRLIAEGLLLSVSMPPKKAMITLKRKFPMGASNVLIKDIILLSNKALSNATRKTRFGGLSVGMALAALIDALYFLSPIRAILQSVFSSAALLSIIDLLLIPLGGYIGAYTARYMAQRPLKRALGSLIPERQRNQFKPKTHNNIWVSYIASAGVLIIILFIAKILGQSIPAWFLF